MPPEHLPRDVDDVAGAARAAQALDQRSVIAAADEAHLLALARPCGRESRRPRFGPGLRLGLAAEREPAPGENLGRHRRQHVRLILGRVGSARDQRRPRPLHDPRVVARGDPRRPDRVRDGRDRREAELAVAPDARVRREAGRVGAHEVVDDRPPEALAEVDRQMGDAQRMAGIARGAHGLWRAARPLAVGRHRVDPQPQRHADRSHSRLHRLGERHGRVDPAAHGHDDAARDGRQPDLLHGRGEGRVQGVDREHGARAGAGGRLDVRVKLCGAQPGGVEHVAALDEPAGELGRRGRVRAGERLVAGDGDRARRPPGGRCAPHRRTPGCRRRPGRHPARRRRRGCARARGRRRLPSTPARRLRQESVPM